MPKNHYSDSDSESSSDDGGMNTEKKNNEAFDNEIDDQQEPDPSELSHLSSNESVETSDPFKTILAQVRFETSLNELASKKDFSEQKIANGISKYLGIAKNTGFVLQSLYIESYKVITCLYSINNFN
jgi:hypothetical protein